MRIRNPCNKCLIIPLCTNKCDRRVNYIKTKKISIFSFVTLYFIAANLFIQYVLSRGEPRGGILSLLLIFILNIGFYSISILKILEAISNEKP